MMASLKIILLLNVVGLVIGYQGSRNGKAVSRSFDQQLYEDVLDTELCDQQLNLLSNNSLRFQFIDASFRLPSGISGGNINDFGDYHQCLRIDQIVEDMEIQGKYCTLAVPLQQDPIDWPSWPDLNITVPDLNITWPIIPDLNVTLPGIDSESVIVIDRYARMQRWALQLAGIDNAESRIFPTLTQFQLGMTLAVCVPKVCTARQAVSFFQQRWAPFLNISYNEYYCRLPGDKPFVAADYVAVIIFFLLGLLIAISTTYDLVQKFYFENDRSSPLFCSFSVYTNTRRLLTFNSSLGVVECMDGIRSISMLWVVVGHTYSFTLTGYVQNQSDILNWMIDTSSTWVHAAPITVDTFFMLSGILVVYTTVGKISRGRFLRVLHMFYLNRFLRMFPLLAAVVLLQASLFNHLSDGPFWQNVAAQATNCRNWWWSTLLHVQNYVNNEEICLPQSWYLSVDTQLYVIAPLVMWWLWSGPRVAWAALFISLGLSLICSSVISFYFNFSAALANINRLMEFNDYIQKYYINTLSRAPPFFVGMVYGYMLHSYRDRKIRISRLNATVLWLFSALVMVFCVVSIYPVMQPDHSAQVFDNILNAYMRAMWAAALGWLIFACAKGYGGPINWFLSLPMWKLPARLSFAVYLIHVPIIFFANGSWVKTHYFTSPETFYRYMSDISLSFLAAFVLCIAIDAPCSTLQKLLFGGGKRRPQKPNAPPNSIVVENERYVKTVL